MAYTPNTWATGDTITAAKLNNMEQGIANAGVFYITATWDDSANGYVLDKTVTQIEAAYANGQLCQITGEMNTVVQVADTPFGTLIAIEPTTSVDNGNNQLVLSVYNLNTQTGVISLTEYFYTLTPAS